MARRIALRGNAENPFLALSKPGVDAASGKPDELIWSSRHIAPRIHLWGKYNVPASGGSSSSTQVVPYAKTMIAKPLVMVIRHWSNYSTYFSAQGANNAYFSTSSYPTMNPWVASEAGLSSVTLRHSPMLVSTDVYYAIAEIGGN